MRPPALLILGALICLHSIMPSSSAVSDGQRPQADRTTDFSLIRPGLSVGPLRLGDTHQRTTELFPLKPNIDQEFSQPRGCGKELNWVDLTNPQVGNMFVRFKDGIVFQIDVATTRFHLTEGIAINSSPQEVRKHYQGLHAYLLSNITSTEVRPLVYWVDAEKGIAFAFAPYRRKHGRYVSKIIVFQPRSEICPSDDSADSPDKQELAPYSLEPSEPK